MLVDDGFLESCVEAEVYHCRLFGIAIGHGEFLVGEGVREHDTASILAGVVLLADFVLEVDHEESNKAHDGVGKEPSGAE